MKDDSGTILDRWANGESVFVNCFCISDILALGLWRGWCSMLHLILLQQYNPLLLY